MIETPDSPELATLCNRIREIGSPDRWPVEGLQLCADAGFYRWFAATDQGGFGWNATDIARGYLALSEADLTTTFILTQRIAALRRIAGCGNDSLKQKMLPKLLTGELTATVGISHLTTSRQHAKSPVVSATQTAAGFLLNGICPWVTGGQGADYILIGASTIDDVGIADGREIIMLVGSDSPGLDIKPGFEMLALTDSQTGTVSLTHVSVNKEFVVAGPIANVLTGNGGGAGGLQTSVLALGLATAAISFIDRESEKRIELHSSGNALRDELNRVKHQLFSATDGDATITAEQVRTQANSLILRATQSAMVAAKGAGFVSGHPVGRWCQEALFFLVWSCPQSVAQANLDEFAPC